MPDKIATATITDIDFKTLESNADYPGTFGFYVLLSTNPGEEWATEFEVVYEGGAYAGKPPVIFQGDRLCVYYLPRYADDLKGYLAFLKGMVTETNRSVEKRNSILPDEEQEKESFLNRLKEAASVLK